jgi:phospholipid transport system substrate-binding protein
MTATVHSRFPVSYTKMCWLRRMAVLGAVVVGLMANAAPSQAARGADLSPAEKFASQAGTQAIATARAGGTDAQLASRFRTLLRRYSNVSSVATFSLGKYARELPATRRAEYNRLVEDFTARLFAAYAGSFAGHQVEVLRSNPRTATDVVVDSRIVFPDNRSPSPVKWLVSKRGGGYTVYDVNVQGVWLSLYIRSKFVSILKQSNGDFDALFAFLRQ